MNTKRISPQRRKERKVRQRNTNAGIRRAQEERGTFRHPLPGFCSWFSLRPFAPLRLCGEGLPFWGMFWKTGLFSGVIR
jgi:hypothetical protein